MSIQNVLKNTRIEFHILQSFPVTCLNRDDVGAPKTAMVGGVQRARVSSQAWKRQVRLTLHELGMKHGVRTKLIGDLVTRSCLSMGATPEQAKSCGSAVEGAFIKKKPEKKAGGKGKKEKEIAEESPVENDESLESSDDSDGKSDTLLFLSPNEIEILAGEFAKHGFNPANVITQKDQKKQAKEIADLIGKTDEAIDGVDIALFGRMVAQAPIMNVEAAASFSHAISTHKVTNEIEFFTALDDLSTEPGSAHMGSIEFNSATYYRYISLDLGQLCQTLAGHDLPNVVEQFTKALFLAVPNARQATQSGASPWAFAKVLVRKGQRLQIPFETAIRSREGGFLNPSIEEMTKYLEHQEKLHGSLFGKIAEYTYGKDDDFSIDDLVSALKTHAQGCTNE